MSAALINRSLTNVRTELEFLYDSEVIDKSLFDTLMESLPKKYAKDMAPWGVDKIPSFSGSKTGSLAASSGAKNAAAESLTDSFKKTSLNDDFGPPSHPPAPAPAPLPVPERVPAPELGYCKASFSYESSESGDLKLEKGDLIAVLEHLSPDWWKGYKKGTSPAQAGVFPSNYVVVVSETEFKAASTPSAPSAPEKPPRSNEKASYEPENKVANLAPPGYQQPQHSSNSAHSQHGYQPQQGYQQQQGYQPQQGYQSQQGYQPQQGYQQQQPSYGGYSQFPPPSTGYYGQQQVQQQQQQQQQQQYPPQQQAAHQGAGGVGSEHLKKFGGKLGNAAIFGAGATIGSDIVNSIF